MRSPRMNDKIVFRGNFRRVMFTLVGSIRCLDGANIKIDKDGKTFRFDDFRLMRNFT